MVSLIVPFGPPRERRPLLLPAPRTPGHEGTALNLWVVVEPGWGDTKSQQPLHKGCPYISDHSPPSQRIKGMVGDT